MNELQVTPKGLTAEEAIRRRGIFGPNELPVQPSTPFWKMVLEQFEDRMVQILLVSAVISFVRPFDFGGSSLLNSTSSLQILAFFEKSEDRATAFLESVVIAVILLVNAVIGVYYENNAEKAIEALKKLEPKRANVHRDGSLQDIPAVELVPGDIVEITAGDKIPADIRLVQIMTPCLRVDQSLLTGETQSKLKKVDACPGAIIAQDKVCLAFSGTIVTAGRASGIVIATGVKTEMGLIQTRMSEAQTKQSPLQDKLDQFGNFLSKVIFVICVVVWLINIPNFGHPTHGSWIRGALYYFKIAVALAVAAIPEGLPAVVTTCLALGTVRMAKKNALVRNLPSVETLGCTTVICSDKTGTLTTNQMSVHNICCVNDIRDGQPELALLSVEGTSYAPAAGAFHMGLLQPGCPADVHMLPLDEPWRQACLAQLARISALCNDARLEAIPGGPIHMTGDGTEGALLTLCEKIASAHTQPDPQQPDQSRRYWQAQYKPEQTLFFTSERRRMSVIARNPAGSAVLMCKGAPEQLLALCSHVRLNAHNAAQPLTPLIAEALAAQIRQYEAHPHPVAYLTADRVCCMPQSQALRCLAFAELEGCEVPAVEDLQDPANFARYESNMVLVGVVAMRDPPRPEVAEALRKFVAAPRPLRLCALVVVPLDALVAVPLDALVAVPLDALVAVPLDALVAVPLDALVVVPLDVLVVVPLDALVAVLVVGLLTTFPLPGRGGCQETAEAVCRQVGLFGPEENLIGRSITGDEFKSMSSAQQEEVVRRGACLFSRTEPAHKERLVAILQAQNNIVAMTGDGVNDAPALNLAHIGIAMGSGTEVAKEASKMILADDNFHTIVAAVEEGRAIFSNTKQFIRYLISSNIGEVVSIFLGAALGIPEALTPVQLLWVNLVTDGLPATALGLNKPDKDIMEHAPRDPKEPIVNGSTFVRYVVIGTYVGLATVFSFIWWFCCSEAGPHLAFRQLTHFHDAIMQGTVPASVFNDPRAPTVALSVLVLVEMFNALNNLSDSQSLLVTTPLSNLWALGACCLSVLLHLGVCYLPFMQPIFGVAALSLSEWAAVVAFSFPVILIDELFKLIARIQHRRQQRRLEKMV
ncbi:ion-transporting P-type ATPase [Paratrimastix pyriformis]|uniref:Ion-transporting P-type ATPase n=1 Tax=Paratrimastix pyriformis TaxID=342808 RepID=A0ABQ8UTK7_9EUKA|nr:ion-transporting P-type ATPase [Paratrimastix pyriformis]